MNTATKKRKDDVVTLLGNNFTSCSFTDAAKRIDVACMMLVCQGCSMALANIIVSEVVSNIVKAELVTK